VYQKNRVEIVRVTPHLYFRRGDMPARRQSNGAFLVSGEVVATVDATTMEAAEEMLQEAVEVFGHPLRYVFLTHGDGDHVAGLPVFLEQPLTIFCSHRLLGQVVPQGYDGPAAFMGIEGVQTLWLGGLEVELSTVPIAAHSPRDLLIRVVQDGCVVAGDTGVSLDHLYFHAADPVEWARLLREIDARGGSAILPGHGDIYPWSHWKEITDFIDLLVQAGNACLEGLSEEEVSALDDDRATQLAGGYLAGPGASAGTIRDTAGASAERELRMVIQALVRKRTGHTA
jgi:glyoxylase-like metal-dependent hydrolase (beta-lactamase superfamily II)